MRGNSFGKLFSITSFGESHGPAMGVIIDGVPSNLSFNFEDLQKELSRRAPGNTKGTTTRKEKDIPEVLSGIYDGKTLGTPICVVIKNTNQKSTDYDSLKNEFRPGHADKTTQLKYGIRDHRGGGRASGRETVARVIGGYFASLILTDLEINSVVTKLGPFNYNEKKFNSIVSNPPYYTHSSIENKSVEDYLMSLQKSGNSIGGKASFVIKNCLPGLGEPCFDKLKADLAKAIMSIGAVVSFSFGLGEEFADIDGVRASSSKENFGGIEGGMSNGSEIILNVVFKPTSTIGEKALEGRHDPCIIPRAIPVVESMIKITIADHFLRQKAYQL